MFGWVGHGEDADEAHMTTISDSSVAAGSSTVGF
jgi:hypothetical protein